MRHARHLWNRRCYRWRGWRVRVPGLVALGLGRFDFGTSLASSRFR